MPIHNKPTLFLITSLIITTGILVYVFTQLGELAQLLLFSAICTLAIILTVFRLLPKKNTNGLLSTAIENNRQQPFSAKILVVDDNKANRRIITQTLKNLNIYSHEAANGKQAINAYNKGKFELILMDLEMDNMNGIETTQHIRKSEKNNNRIPIIAISAHNRKEKIHSALSAGFDDFLTKPVDDENLKETINRWLNIANLNTLPIKKIDNKTQALPPSSIEKIDQDLPIAQGKTINKVVDIKQSLNYSHNDPELAKDMLVMLINLIIEERENIQSYFDKQEWDKLEQIVHKLNGGSCYCGVPELQEHAELIDKALQSNRTAVVENHFAGLIKSIDALIQWNNEYDVEVIFDI